MIQWMWALWSLVPLPFLKPAWTSGSSQFMYCWSSGTTGSYGSSISSFLRNPHTVLHSGRTNLHFHWQCLGIPFSPHSLQHLLFVHFLIATILTVVRWYLIMVLICIPLIMRGVEHLFMCLLAICMSSSEKCLFSSLAHFLIGHLFFWNWAAWAACIFLRLNLFQLLHLLLFSPNLFTLLIVYFTVQNVWSSIRYHFFLILFLFPLLLEVGHRGSCCDLCQRVFYLCFPLGVL